MKELPDVGYLEILLVEVFTPVEKTTIAKLALLACRLSIASDTDGAAYPFSGGPRQGLCIYGSKPGKITVNECSYGL
jgi:hypothetical protein